MELPANIRTRREPGPSSSSVNLPMSAPAPMWVRVGGGMESIPEHLRHGPADVDFPPPGGPWEPLVLNGRLVGWGERSGLGFARRSAERGQQLADEHRDYLLGRLGHKLRSSLLALQESARQAAFGRPGGPFPVGLAQVGRGGQLLTVDHGLRDTGRG